MTLSALISQCFVYGDSLRNACVAVVIPEEAAVVQWATEQGINFSAPEQLYSNQQLKQEIGKEMLRLA